MRQWETCPRGAEGLGIHFLHVRSRGFSDKPAATGWDVHRIARAWAAFFRSVR
jgi:hypothetical protein